MTNSQSLATVEAVCAQVADSELQETETQEANDDRVSLFKRLSNSIKSAFKFGKRQKVQELADEGDEVTEEQDLQPDPVPTNRFLEALKRIQRSVDYNPLTNSVAPYGFYTGRPIIGECTQINGGIFIGALPHEAVVIDRKYGLLELMEAELMNRIARRRDNHTSIEHRMVSEALRLTQETLRYDPAAVQALLEREKIESDQKIALDVFIKERTGLARHQVLLAGYLLEHLKDGELLRGCLCIDSQTNQDQLEDERLIYTSLSGHLLIFQPGVKRA